MSILIGAAFIFIAIFILTFFKQVGTINKNYDKTNYFAEEDSNLK